jgi:anti-anti-sigma factor
MAIQYKKNKDEILIYVKGELDEDRGFKFFEFVKEHLSEFNSFVINLEYVNYINTEGLSYFISICNLLKDKKYIIDKMEENIKEIFLRVGLLNYIPFKK